MATTGFNYIIQEYQTKKKEKKLAQLKEKIDCENFYYILKRKNFFIYNHFFQSNSASHSTIFLLLLFCFKDSNRRGKNK